MSRLAGGFAGVAALTVACGGVNSDRAGGAGIVEPVVLTMAQPNDGPPDQLLSWAEEVAARSDGSLVIEFANEWRIGEAEYETGTIDDVRAGEVDLAWAGARAFDRVGVTSFQPLLAPLLVDSHDLQAAVFDAGIPEEMMAELGGVDLTGIGVLPGPMRKLLGVSHAFITPGDFEGAVIGMQDSGVAERTAVALGATGQVLPSGADITDVDAYEQQLSSIAGNDYWRQAGYVTANLNLWPRPLVLFINGDAFDALTEEQQAALRHAAAASVDDSLAASREEDASGVPYLCEQGMTLAVAGDDDLAALRSALQPVYDQIAADPANAAWLDEIQALKEQVAAPPDTAECPATEGTDTATDLGTFPSGTFETTVTGEDFVRACGDDGGVVEARLYATFADGWLEQGEIRSDGTRELGFRAYYSVIRDRVELEEPGVAGRLLFRWTFDGTNLVLSDLADDYGHCMHHGVWEHTWVLVEPSAPSTTEPVEDGAAVNLDGVYQWTITDEDAIAYGTPNDQTPSGLANFPDTFTMVLDGGTWTMSETSSPDQPVGTYEVFRDQVVFTWSNGGLELAFTYTIAEDGMLTLTPDEGMPEGDAFIWSTRPWLRIGD